MPLLVNKNKDFHMEELVFLPFSELFQDTLESRLAELKKQGNVQQLIFALGEDDKEQFSVLSQEDIKQKIDALIKRVEQMEISFSIVLPILPLSFSQIRVDRQKQLNDTIFNNYQKNYIISSKNKELNPILRERSKISWNKQMGRPGRLPDFSLDIDHIYTDQMQAQCDTDAQVGDETQQVQNQEIRVDNSDADQYGPLYNYHSITNFVLSNREKFHAFSGEYPRLLWQRLADPINKMNNNDYLNRSTAGFYTTAAATQQILAYYHQFQFGLDFNHLPVGFRLIQRDIKNEAQIILDYDPKQALLSLKDDPLSISTRSILAPTSLRDPLRLLDAYIKQGEKTKGYSFIKKIYDTLKKTAPDDKATANLLLQYLPLLSNIAPFNDPADLDLAQWFFDEKDGSFRTEAFDYLFQHVEEIAKVYLDKHDISSISLSSNNKHDRRTEIIVKNLNHYFDPTYNSFYMLLRSNGTTFKAICCCQHYAAMLAKPVTALENQLLYILINNDCAIDSETREALFEQLRDWQRDLALTQLGVNNLTEIYQKRGSAGLKQLFNLWKQWKAIELLCVTSSHHSEKKDLLTRLYDISFKNCHSYLSLLELEQDTIEQIKRFYLEPDVARFWETLLTQHYQVVTDDDLSKLVNSFQAFLDQLPKRLGNDDAAAKKLPTLQYPIKSLPVALSRILSLLEHCRPEDRLKQWECVGSLDFSSQGVPRAILYHYLFVLPEMGRKPKECKEMTREYVVIPTLSPEADSSRKTVNELVSYSRQKKADAALLATKDRSCIITDLTMINLLKSNFFEYIAAQSSALPLHFYQEAEKVILPTFHPILLLNLYRYLAASTTNDAALYTTNDSNLLKLWKNFVNNFNELTSKMMYRLPESVRSEALKRHCAPNKGAVNLTALVREAASVLEPLLEKSVSACIGLPLPIFLKIMDYVANVLDDEDLEDPQSINGTLDQIKQALDGMAVTAQSYKEVYLGLCNPFESHQDRVKPNKEISFLFNYCKTVEVIIQNQTIDDLTRSKLISLITTFQLQSSDITNIIDKINSINVKQKEELAQSDDAEMASVCLLDFLVTLLLIKSVGHKKGHLACLTGDDLFKLLDALPDKIASNYNASDIRTLLCHLIEEHLPDYYDDTCLQQLLNGEQGLSLHPGLNDLIRLEFHDNPTAQRQVEYFLERCLLNPADVSRIRIIFNVLLKLYQLLDNEPETQKNLLKELEYIATVSDAKSVEELYPLLNRMSRGNTTVLDFIHFIKREKEKNSGDSSHLHQRLRYYLDSMTQLRKQKLSVNIIERFSGLFEQLLLNTQEKVSLVPLQTLQGAILKLINADRHTVEPLFVILSALTSIEEMTSFLQYFTRCVTWLEKKLLENTSRSNFGAIQRNLLQYGKEKPEILFKCLKGIDEKLTQDASKVGLLGLLSIFLRQETALNDDVFYQLIDYFAKKENDQDSILETIIACYKIPPYMPLAGLIKALNEDQETFRSRYDQFSKEPHSREAANRFDLKFAQTQKNKFINSTLSEEEIQQLSVKISEVKKSSMEELQRNLSQLKQKSTKTNLSADEKIQLVACLAELLYRSNSTPEHSFELNTTQYLAILAMLNSDGRAIAEIATSEGKSRIMMLLAASQYILGKTTDFVSSDFELAQRDYFAYSPFFLALGAEIRLITADSPINDYTKNAIHFSDTTQLSHFRNRARISREMAIDPDESKRSLLIDEVDATLYDKAQTRFNYSSPDKDMKDIKWIYPLLVKFILKENEEQSPDKFITFLKELDHSSKIQFTKEQCQQLNSIDDSQLQTWLESAYKATQLKLNQHFVIKPDQRQVTSAGAVMTKSSVFVLHENRVYPDSRYSAGVHECLEAFLEMKRCEAQKNVGDHQELREVLKQCKTPFSPKTEVRILCSSNTYDLFHAYQSGNLLGVTGTLGSEHEKQEVSALYQNSDRPIQFIKAPRHKSLRRIDQPIRLAANSKRQAQLLMAYIQAAHEKNQPVLLISKNQQKSNELFQAIKNINAKQPEAKRISVETYFQQIPCDLPTKEERSAIIKAGQPGMISFGTSILGRGVDITLQQEQAEQKGLLVLLDYLPESKRDYGQIVGRSGRYGALGETRLVVTRDDINFNYYLNSEQWKEEKWQEGAKKTQSKRILEFLLSNIYMKFQNKFSFNHEYFNQWSEFFKGYRDLHVKIKEKIIHLFQSRKKQKKSSKKGSLNDDVMYQKINNHKKEVNEIYQAHIPSDEQVMESVLNDEEQEKIENFFLHHHNLHDHNVVSAEKSDAIPIYKNYDPALDGRAKVYKALFVETRAVLRGERKFFANTRAAFGGAGILFADTRAALHGKRPLFGNLIYSSCFKKNRKTRSSRSL